MPKIGTLRQQKSGWWVCIIMTASLCGFAHGEWISVGNSTKVVHQHSDVATNSILQRSNQNSTDFTLSVNGLQSEAITVQGETYSKLSFPGEATTHDMGKPSLPKVVKLIAIPSTGNVELEVEAGSATVLEGVKIPPDQDYDLADMEALGRTLYFDNSCYGQDAFYPGKLGEMSDPMIARDLRVVAVVMYPVQYNPVTHQLKIYSNLTVSLRHTGGTGVNEKQTPPRRISRSMMEFYRGEVLNVDSLGLDDPTGTPGTLLMICANDASVLAEVNKIADWKRKKGINTVVVTTAVTGTSSSQIYNYILNLYNNPGSAPALEYVTLVGDGSGSWSVAPDPSGNGSDFGYSMLAGSDNIAEIAVGRLSFSSITELQIIRAKILKYESDPYMTGSNPDWFQDAWMYAGTSYGTSTIHTLQYVRQLLLDAGYHDVQFSTHSGHVDETTINNHLNPGIGIWNHRPIWISEIYCSDCDALNNGWMMPMCLNLTCDTGDWVSGTAISECLLREGTITQPQGAIAAIATATSGTHAAYNNSIDGSFFHAMFSLHQYTAGSALSVGKAHFLWQWVGDSYAPNFCYWNNLMGDPTVEIWTGTPATMTASYPSSIAVGTNMVTVTVRDGASQPLAGAYVNAYKVGQTLYGELTPANGTVVLPVTATTVDTLFITVSKHNYKSVVGYALVQNATRNVTPLATVVDDDNTGYSHGNGNAIPNPGEGLELAITLKNWGTLTSNNVSATISSSDPHVASFGTTTLSYGNIAAGAQFTPAGRFQLTLSNSIPDNYSLELNLTVTDNTPGTYQSVVVLTVKEVNLEYISRSWLNAGNSIFDAGETVNLSVTLKNQGHVDAAAGITATCASSHPLITVLDASGTYPAIAQGATASNSTDLFQLHADSSLFNGTPFRITLYLQNAAGFHDTVTFNDTLGSHFITDPLGPDGYGYYAFDNGDAYYSKHPSYSWVEIDPTYGGTGTVLSLPDYGENQDCSVLVTPPFTMQYYGRSFTTITVCSNGWFAMGNQTSNAYPQNWRIPGALGALSQVSVYWDDFFLASSGDRRVWTKNDATNHRFIIEWSRVYNSGSGASETFEAIILNEAYYPTPTNDTEILCQYNYVTNGDAADHYASVGIDNEEQTIGMEYTYNNQYPTQAALLANGRAILFTTDPGSLVNPPNIVVDPSSITTYAAPGDSVQSNLYIRNTGQSSLDFSIYVSYTMNQAEGITNYELGIRNSESRITTGGGADSHGGPDTYGNMWIDSDDAGGPTYSWVEIAGIGTNSGITGDDQNVGPFSLGFTMNYYGTNYTSVRLCSNGWMSFTASTTEYTNYGIPNSSSPNNIIAPFWDDLYPPTSGRVYYYQDAINHRFIVQWDTIALISSSARYTFEAILNADGSIVFQYQNIYGTISGSTIGIENQSGTDGLQVAYNQAYVHNNLAVLFYLPNRWLSVSPLTGSVEAGGVDTLRLVSHAGTMSLGSHLANMNISNSDPNNSLVVVPVTLVVANNPAPPAAVDDLVIGRLGNHITLAWQPVTQNVNGQPITVGSYSIYSSTEPHFTPAPGNRIGTTTGTSFLHTNGLLNNRLRFYRVTAVQ